jgi:hypothetical protein
METLSGALAQLQMSRSVLQRSRKDSVMIASNHVRIFVSRYETGSPDRRFATVPGVDDYALLFLYAGDELGVFDAIVDRERSLLEIADLVDVNVHTLGRILRALADQGFLLESPEGRFALVDPDLPSRIALSKFVQVDPELIRASTNLVHAVRTGGVPFHRIYSANFIPFVCG